jgi:hypothetical protein
VFLASGLHLEKQVASFLVTSRWFFFWEIEFEGSWDREDQQGMREAIDSVRVLVPLGSVFDDACRVLRRAGWRRATCVSGINTYGILVQLICLYIVLGF